jgi:hypothetical protein
MLVADALGVVLVLVGLRNGASVLQVLGAAPLTSFRVDPATRAEPGAHAYLLPQLGRRRSRMAMRSLSVPAGVCCICGGMGEWHSYSLSRVLVVLELLGAEEFRSIVGRGGGRELLWEGVVVANYCGREWWSRTTVGGSGGCELLWEGVVVRVRDGWCEWQSMRVAVGVSGGRCEWRSVRVVFGASGGHCKWRSV